MENVTDILTLGTIYTVTDPRGNNVGQIQIIPQSEILDASIGPYDFTHGSYTDYLNNCLSVLTGFEDVDPLRVLWYTTYEEEIILSDIVEYAVKHGYNKIILEFMLDADDIN